MFHRLSLTICALFLTPFLAGPAHANPLQPGELVETADTVPKGHLAGHTLFTPSAYGITDSADVKLTLLELMVGPSLSVEKRFVQKDRFAVSIEPNFSSLWDFTFVETGATLHSSFAFAAPASKAGHTLHLSVGAQYWRWLERTEGTDETSGEVELYSAISTGAETPISLMWDRSPNDHTTWRLTGKLYPLSTKSSICSGSGTISELQASWNHAFEKEFRMTLGLGLLIPDASSSSSGILVEWEALMPALPVLPYPMLAAWWYF